jgi:carbon starvation protein CstA
MSSANKSVRAGVAGLGAVACGIVALTRGEPVNAAWLVVAGAVQDMTLPFLSTRRDGYSAERVERASMVQDARQTCVGARPAF